MRHLLKGAFAILLSVAFISSVKAQGKIENPVSWKTTQTQLNDTEFVLIMHATLEKGWHIYAEKLDTSAVQVPTAFTYVAGTDYKTTGATEEHGKLITLVDTSPKEIENYFEDSVTYRQKIVVHNKTGFILKANVYYESCNIKGFCLAPKQVDFTFTVPPVKKTEGVGYWGIFFLGLGIGLAALLTPCVFPMIPLTVSFFLKKNSSPRRSFRDALIYGGSIVFIYVALAALVTALSGSDGLNAIASNGWMNLFFFIIFVVFGISLLGAFELTLPSSWGNSADSASDRGGLLGIFFMALTLCIVSFSCTGPFLGYLLAGASLSNQYWSLIVGTFSFSFSLALPFMLFALFPSWLTSLPKSGGWLNSIKVVFGLFELAFALKFLSTADLVGLHIKFLHFHINGPMGILKREIFLVLWIIIFIIMGFYLLGRIKFSHDSDLKHVSVTRLLLAILAFSFSLYLIPGLFGAPLKLIGGFPPPSFYSEGWGLSESTSSGTNTSVTVPGAKKKIGCPLGLNCFNDYDEAVVYARKVDKPIMIDFTGFSCVNCRKMEVNVWSDPKVLAIIKNDYVLVSLYVDEKNELPADMQMISKTTGQKIETYGDKWSDMETSLFQSNTQPLYALVNVDGSLLTPARGYTPDIDQYTKFLQAGKNNFHPSAAAVK